MNKQGVNKTELQSQTQLQEDRPDEYHLYCRSCKHIISKHADVCPHCGDTDPFFFKKLKQEEHHSQIGCLLLILASALTVYMSRLLGKNGGLMNPGKYELIAFVAIFLAVFVFIKWIYSVRMSRVSRKYKAVAKSMNYMHAQEIWRKTARKIIRSW